MRFLDAGIDFFLDLTEAGEQGFEPYAASLDLVGAAYHKRVTYRRLPIRDVSTASTSHMITILDAVDGALAEGRKVYVHCWGGVGRTGTVVGCYLVRHRMAGVDALTRIATLRQGTPDGWRASPETNAQRAMVLDWLPGR